MDDVTRQRFDRIDQRMDDLPKAMATAFTLAVDNAQASIMKELAIHMAAYEERSQAAAQRRHEEQMRKFQETMGLALGLHQHMAQLEARVAKLEAAAGQPA